MEWLHYVTKIHGAHVGMWYPAHACHARGDRAKRGNGNWWLRTAGTNPDVTCAAIVNDDGNVNPNGQPVNNDNIGASPA